MAVEGKARQVADNHVVRRRMVPAAVVLILLASLTSAPATAQSLAAPAWLRGLLPGQPAAPAADPLAPLNLTGEQRSSLEELARQQARMHLETMERIARIQSRLPGLYAAEILDEKAIDEAYAEMFELQRRVIVHAARTYNAQLDLLDDQQRTLWSELKRGGAGPGS